MLQLLQDLQAAWLKKCTAHWWQVLSSRSAVVDKWLRSKLSKPGTLTPSHLSLNPRPFLPAGPGLPRLLELWIPCSREAEPAGASATRL